jgi:hypothetical protein
MYIQRKYPGVSDGYKKMIFGFVIVTVLLVGIIFYFSASKAVIKITPRSTPLETDFVSDVVADGGAENALQAVIYETELSDSIRGDATGSKALGGNSIGKVIVYNKRGEPQTLVKTTRLQNAEGILLRLTDRVVVPANGQVEADVYADDPSAFTELLPVSFIIPGLSPSLQKFVYAESKVTLKPTGSSVKAIKAVDIVRAKDKLNEQIYNKAIEEFSKQLPAGQEFTKIVVSRKVLEEKISDNVDAVKDNFTVTTKLKLVLLALDQKKIIDLAGERLRAIVPAGQQLVNLNLGNFSYKVQNYDETKKTANIKVHVAGDVVIKAENPILDKEKLSGLSAKGVTLYLDNFKEVEDVSVELSPFWVKSVPGLKDHIIITILNPKSDTIPTETQP